jgi:hypothetical protein
MKHKRCWLGALLGVALLAATAILSEAQNSDTPKSDEFLILGDANRGAGEPMIAVNRKDPNNIVIVAMASLHRLPNGEAPDGTIPANGPGVGGSVHSMTQRVRELSTQDETVTDIAVTRDGGKTWDFSVDSFRQAFHRNRCHDSFAGAGPDGTMYYGCIPHIASDNTDFDEGYTQGGEPKNMRGGSAIAWSNNKGKTWSQPVWVHPDHSPQLYAPNLAGKLRFQYASPWDRPYFATDDSTGTIYVSGNGGGTFIRASHDNGKTWGIIYSLASDDYPGGGGFGSTFSAGHGLLVTAYTANSVPASLNVACPCPVLGSSKDDGKTWDHYLLPRVTSAAPTPAAAPGTPAGAPGAGRGGGGGGGGGFMIAIDPSKAGRYALARMTATTMTVSVTQDGGKTWSEPVLAAEAPAGTSIGHRGMKYSPKGDLALFWIAQIRAPYPDGGYDMWTSASRDGGRSFKAVRVSHELSPVVSRERGNFLFGNDLSTMDVDNQYVHVVWGDNRTGFLGTWYGRVPLSAY